ncbi:YoaK family protein [Peptoniphilus asaccharolyticus]
MDKKIQMSETVLLGVLLAISGGFMDAYSYIFRDHVFANAQTGNIILFGIHLSEGNIHEAIKYFWPVIAFAAGIILADFFKYFEHRYKLHWRQLSVLVEIFIFSIVAFIPTDYNLLANSLISLSCGIQVESFRKIYSHSIATTMCIGNLRSGTENLYSFLMNRDKVSLRKTRLYFGIILCFVIGAILGNIFIELFAAKAILMSSIILSIVFLLMFVDIEPKNKFFK